MGCRCNGRIAPDRILTYVVARSVSPTRDGRRVRCNKPFLQLCVEVASRSQVGFHAAIRSDSPNPHSSAAFGALIVLASTGVSAQPIPVPTLPLVAWSGLSQDDVDRMHAAAARLYEGRSIGTVERWRSPDSKIAGEVKLVRSFETHGMPCRTIDYTVRFQPGSDALNHYVANWCRVAGDAWKIVELARPR